VTRQITVSGDAPRLAAASSAARSWLIRPATDSRTTHGMVMTRCARISPISDPVSAQPVPISISTRNR
jgi:hypothetical protein